MAKWADYLISGVRYSNSYGSKRISDLRVHTDGESSVGASSTWSKDRVVASIRSRNSFKTIYKGADGNWKKGEDVRVVIINYRDYLRTDANNIEEDNLGNLPEF